MHGGGEKLDGIDRQLLVRFQAHVPGWYVAPKAFPSQSFPLGAYDPDPQKSWLAAWGEQQHQHPHPVKPMDSTGPVSISISPIVAPNLDRNWHDGEQNRPVPGGDTSFGSGF